MTEPRKYFIAGDWVRSRKHPTSEGRVIAVFNALPGPYCWVALNEHRWKPETIYAGDLERVPDHICLATDVDELAFAS